MRARIIDVQRIVEGIDEQLLSGIHTSAGMLKSKSIEYHSGWNINGHGWDRIAVATIEYQVSFFDLDKVYATVDVFADDFGYVGVELFTREFIVGFSNKKRRAKKSLRRVFSAFIDNIASVKRERKS